MRHSILSPYGSLSLQPEATNTDGPLGLLPDDEATTSTTSGVAGSGAGCLTCGCVSDGGRKWITHLACQLSIAFERSTSTGGDGPPYGGLTG